MSEASINQGDLPTTWALTNLGSVINYGSTNKAEPNEIADGDWILELEDIEKDSSRLLQKMTFLQRQSKSTKNHFQAGDVLYGKLRPYLNKVLIAGESGYCTTEILPLKTGAQIDNRYLFYWLKHPVFLKYVETESHGMNMPRLGTETGKAAPFVLAPRNEQTRIANQLDTLLARVQACNDRFDAIPALLKRFRQTVLDDCLLEDQSTVSVESSVQPWALRTVGSLCASISDGPFGSNLKSADYTTEGVQVVRLENIGHLFFDAKKETFISTEKYKALSKHTLSKGDLLFSSFVDEEVRVCEFPNSNLTINKADCFRLRVDETQCNRLFLLYRLACKSTYQSLKEQVHGATRPRINLTQLRGYEILLPALAKQAEIVSRVEDLFAMADRIEARCTTARAQAQRLTPLVLAKSFRGELVPQDPTDEPASALLARIASSKTAVAGKNRQKVPLAPI